MTYSDIRTVARQRLSGNWLMAALMTLLATVLGVTFSNGINFKIEFKFQVDDPELVSEVMENTLMKFFPSSEFLYSLIPNIFFVVTLGIVLSVIGTAVAQGYYRYILNIADARPSQLEDLFSQFQDFGRAFTLHFLMGLYTFLWSLLLVIPGIVASYRYAMAPYIMLDHPELSPSECIRRSCEIMDGHKGELFTLHLTFIGWSILAAFTFGIGNLFLQPYTTTSDAIFYRELVGPGYAAPEAGMNPPSSGTPEYL